MDGVNYRLCLRIGDHLAMAVSFWANTPEGAQTRAAEIFAEYPEMSGYDLWSGSKRIAQGTRSSKRGG
jgi:hypothetical protein